MLMRERDERLARLAREQAEKATLERIEYEAGERAWLEEPDVSLPLVGGPIDGELSGPRACACLFCEGGHNTWPIRPEVSSPEGSIRTGRCAAERAGHTRELRCALRSPRGRGRPTSPSARRGGA